MSGPVQSTRPRRTATAAASVRVVAPSLIRMFDTWCPGGLAADVERRRDLRIGEPGGDELEHLHLARASDTLRWHGWSGAAPGEGRVHPAHAAGGRRCQPSCAAPRAWSSDSAWRIAPSSLELDRASAASYTQPRADQHSTAPAQSPLISNA